jgi:hypothetical protein
VKVLIKRLFVRPVVAIVLSCAVLAGTPLLGQPGTSTVAHAQARDSEDKLIERRSLIDLLFRRKEPAPQIQEVPKREVKRARVTPQTRQSAPASAPAAEAPAAAEKLENALAILVVGDFTAGGLAQGLKEAFEEVPSISIESRSNGSSGFVRDDFYDWPKSIGPIIEKVKPALVVMMIGSNDRQAMRVDGRTEKVRTDAWEKEYKARIEKFAKTVQGTNTPLIWVGGPPYRFKSMSADILAFNEFYRQAADAVGGSFVDIWDGFVDKDGAFVLRGSDINGQIVQLRNSDGINFTTAGKRKLAFYVERQIKQMFGDAASSLLTVLAPESYPTMRLPPLQVEDVLVRLDPIPINDPELDGGAALLGDIAVAPELGPANPLQAKSLRNRLVEDGIPPPAKPGRANNFTWPPA